MNPDGGRARVQGYGCRLEWWERMVLERSCWLTITAPPPRVFHKCSF